MTDSAAPGASPEGLPTSADPALPPPAHDARSFAELGVRPEVLKALTAMGFIHPMEVQRSTYPLIIAGRDVMVQSRTGSGKTAAFGIPFAQGLVDPQLQAVQALVLCPTRELALQVGDECTRIGEHRGLSVAAIYGGAPMGKQIDALRAGAQIVGGTPGRVLDHLRRGTLSLDRLRILVLDEADVMFSMGFYEEISDIIQRCPKDRQTLLFSATFPSEIERIAERHMRDPEKLSLSRDYVGVHEITHAYYMVSGMGRSRDLLRILSLEKPGSAIIFCNTREETSFLAEQLRRGGLDAEAISSDLAQRDRERVMARSKAHDLKYLVATDIAARGIDISDLTHVFNYTFPESAEVYVHRTGRTGRAGKSGIAISLISPRELGNFYYLKLTYKIRPQERQLPSEEELATRRDDERLAQVQAQLGAEPTGSEWVSLARRLLATTGSAEATLAKLLERFLRPAEAEARPLPGPSETPAAIAAPTTTPVEARPQVAPTVESAAERPVVRDRDRGERRDPDRGGRGERGPGSRADRARADRDARREKRDRSRNERAAGRPPLAAPSAPATVETPAKRALPGSPFIEATEGREFWEAWIDDRGGGPAAGPEAPPAAAPEEARPPRTAAAAPPPPPEGSVKLYLNLGRRDKVTDEELHAWLRERGVEPMRLDVRGNNSFLFLPEEAVEPALGVLHGAQMGDRAVVCERARR